MESFAAGKGDEIPFGWLMLADEGDCFGGKGVQVYRFFWSSFSRCFCHLHALSLCMAVMPQNPSVAPAPGAVSDAHIQVHFENSSR